MSSIIDGFKDQVWRIIEMDGTEQISEQHISLSEATESQIIDMIEAMAKRHLTELEITDTPSLSRAVRDSDHGNRITYSAGENPHVIASLWRADELP
ncbi:hypothetical protein [Rhizobium leguminosarum]|uniref:hypothetical protein n=1 Tax=Rhizobium leguminosarum TaxID=384 RepID=UPI001031A642|nr:hypothetical protein [Rhizobium leguminosarum]TAV89300.1 hypothetical protein ELI22_08785 [Rhizobium leguminosarum]TAV93881.1 hypothetical protein ELI21_08775 [Rhizobium leguminosarum]TAW34958.1 hypothetical protein ELI23_08815 [Rhizobium leguminosarum]